MAELFKFENIDDVVNSQEKKNALEARPEAYLRYKDAIKKTREGLKQHIPSEQMMNRSCDAVAMNKRNSVDSKRNSGT